jgi:hypothetical protein
MTGVAVLLTKRADTFVRIIGPLISDQLSAAVSNIEQKKYITQDLSVIRKADLSRHKPTDMTLTFIF